jgi:tetratricopeptide (TPR) repeat protein
MRRFIQWLIGLELLLREFLSYLPLRFVTEWFGSRSYRDLLFGIPAGTAAMLLVTGAIATSADVQTLTVDACVDKAISAKRTGDDDLVALYLHQAQLAVVGTDQGRFNQALLSQSLGRSREALAIMRRLAPENQPGFVPAHEWIVQGLTGQLLQEVKKEEPSEDDTRLRSELVGQIERQYQMILKANPKHLVANEQLMRMRLGKGDLAAAAEHLSRIVDENQNWRSIYAELLAKLNKKEEALSEANRAVRFHQEHLAEEGLEVDVKVQHRVKLAQAFLVLEEYQSAVNSITSDGELLAEDARLRAALGSVFFLWSESIDATEGDALAGKMELLGRALALRPNDVKILQRIAIMAGKDGKAADEAATTLKQVLASGRAPAVVHFVLGMNALNRQDAESALRHLELAHRGNPNTPVTLNNLAVLISREEPPDLERAIGLADKAIELSPKTAEFYDSRGGIYLKMERYTDAIADLERAIQRLPGRADIHSRLAEAYEALGDAELAKMHRDHAEQARTAKPPKVPAP